MKLKGEETTISHGDEVATSSSNTEEMDRSKMGELYQYILDIITYHTHVPLDRTHP